MSSLDMFAKHVPSNTCSFFSLIWFCQTTSFERQSWLNKHSAAHKQKQMGAKKKKMNTKSSFGVSHCKPIQTKHSIWHFSHNTIFLAITNWKRISFYSSSVWCQTSWLSVCVFCVVCVRCSVLGQMRTITKTEFKPNAIYKQQWERS